MEDGKKQDTNFQILHISLFDLGIDPLTMKKNWNEVKSESNVVFLKEFPDINFSQVLDNTKKDVLDVCLAMVECIQENNKILAKERQREGIQKARKMGIKLGRKPRDIPNDFYNAYEKCKKRELTYTAMTKMFDVNYKTLKKWIVQIEMKESVNK